MASETNSTSNKLLGMEVLRFLTAVAVLLWHYRHFFYLVPDAPGKVEKLALYDSLTFIYLYGGSSVLVFWCLSGFIFFWKYRDAIASGLIDGKKFFILRFSRLYPLHIATLLLVTALQVIFFHAVGVYFVYQQNSPLLFIEHLFMASNWWSEQRSSFNGPIWSVSTELVAYFAFFMITSKISKSVLVNIAIFASYVAYTLTGHGHIMVDCIAFFYLGGLTAYLSLAAKRLPQKHRRSLYRLFCFLVCLAPLIVWNFKIYEHFERSFFVYWFLIFYMPPLFFCLSQDFNPKPAIRKAIEAAGNMTYSSYLIHFPLQILIALFCAATDTVPPIYNPLFFSGFIATTLIAAHFTYQCFEAPAQRYIRQKFDLLFQKRGEAADSSYQPSIMS